jgi:hypothetical protein
MTNGLLEKLTLASLQEWVDDICPVKVDLSKPTEGYIISKVEVGIAGRVRTVLDIPRAYACISTHDYAWENGLVIKVKIRFGYVNFLINEQVSDYKWFSPQDR